MRCGSIEGERKNEREIWIERTAKERGREEKHGYREEKRRG